MGVDPTQIPTLTAPEFTHSWQRESIGAVVNSQFVQRVLSSVSEDVKQKIKNIVPKRNKSSAEKVDIVETNPKPIVTEMMAELQQSQYKLTFDKAQRIIGYEPLVSFDEGCRRSIEWLVECRQFDRLLNK